VSEVILPPYAVRLFSKRCLLSRSVIASAARATAAARSVLFTKPARAAPCEGARGSERVRAIFARTFTI